MKVGFIGLGKMGAGICSNIVKNGIYLVVYDINPANMQKFVDMGASSAATVKVWPPRLTCASPVCPCPKTPRAFCQT
ncbi:MAG: NAD(P)-binding domain-containing protein [Bilophila wadsworthia]